MRLRFDREDINARQHSRYRQRSDNDDLYHCQFAESENCDRKFDKLKCDYE
jgi:hypothetical protein